MKHIKGSSTIDAIDHDGKTLTVHFHGGSVYDFVNFPDELHTKWMEHIDAGGSAGKWFHQNIKPHYEGKKRESQ